MNVPSASSLSNGQNKIQTNQSSDTSTTKDSIHQNHKSIGTISLLNNPTIIQSSKTLNSKSSSNSVSNLSKLSSKKSLLNTKPKSISNLSIHTVK